MLTFVPIEDEFKTACSICSYFYFISSKWKLLSMNELEHHNFLSTFSNKDSQICFVCNVDGSKEKTKLLIDNIQLCQANVVLTC